MRSRTNPRFKKAFQKLPEHVQRQAREAYRTFVRDGNHPSLQFKQVHPSKPIFSARVGLGYRALAVRDADDLIWFWIGSHAEYDRLISTNSGSVVIGRHIAPNVPGLAKLCGGGGSPQGRPELERSFPKDGDGEAGDALTRCYPP